MPEDRAGETATLPEDRDFAIRQLWRRVFGADATEAEVDQNRADRVATRLEQVELRLDRVDDQLGRIDGRLGQVETRLAVVETRMSAFETVAIRLDAAVVRLQDNSRTDFRLIFGAIIATALGLAGMMAKGFHWL